jgi:hypothetical protein
LPIGLFGDEVYLTAENEGLASVAARKAQSQQLEVELLILRGHCEW